MTTPKKSQHSIFDRLYTGEGGIDFVGRTKQWYIITAVLLLIGIGGIAVRGFDMSIDFEGGTKLNMPAAELNVDDVENTFVDATGVTPELTQVVGSGDTATLEINSERLTEDQISQARRAIFEKYQPKDATGTPSPDAVGDSTVSESWGSTITNRMIISMVVFLLAAFVYIAIRLQRAMAAAAMIALLVDAVLIAGIYALFGFEVSPAAIIGLLTVLAFSVYDTVIVFDKVRENTEGIFGSRKQTFAEAANAAVNETFMRSISTSVISALPIISMMVVAVWMLGVGDLKDLALIQLIGVVEGVISSIFLATPILVQLENRRADVKAHNREVERFRAGELDPAETEGTAEHAARRVRLQETTAGDAGDDTSERTGVSWRPGQSLN